MNLPVYLKEQRPALSDSSIKTYTSIITSLMRKLLDNPTPVLSFLEDMPPNRRKTILSALVVATGNEQYRKLMMQDSQEYSNQIEKQVKSEKQMENSISQDELHDLLGKYKKIAAKIYKKTTDLVWDDFEQLQNYVLLALYSGHYIIPRRSLD